MPNIVCRHCGALHWIEERIINTSKANPSFICCNNGQVRLPAAPEYPEEFMALFSNRDFLTHIRAFNDMFAFASLHANVDSTLLRQFPFTFKINGTLHHRMGPLRPINEGDAPRYAQIYFLPGASADERLEAHIQQTRTSAQPNVFRDIAQQVQRILDDINPYVKHFLSASALTTAMAQPNFSLRILEPSMTGHDPRTYNTPTVDEVAALIVDEDTATAHGKSCCIRIVTINSMHPSYNALRYPLLFPRGEQGWHTRIPVSHAQWPALGDNASMHDLRNNVAYRLLFTNQRRRRTLRQRKQT